MPRALILAVVLIFTACARGGSLSLGDASTADASIAPDASTALDASSTPIDATAAPDASSPPDTGACTIAIGAPQVISDPSQPGWEVSIDAHHGVTVAAWISTSSASINGLIIRAAVAKDGAPFGAPFTVPITRSYGDPTVRFAPDGTLYIGSICDVGTVLPPSDICVVYSSDDGAHFSPTVRVSDAPKDSSNLRDRPWIGAAPDGRIAVTYLDAEVDAQFNIMGSMKLDYRVGTSSGGALAFGPNVEIDPGHLPTSGGYNGTYSAPLAFDQAGRFHIAYEIGDFTPSWFSLRYDETTGPDLAEMSMPGSLGQGGYPVSATAGSSSVGVLTYGASGVLFLRSDDGGAHFAPPLSLGDATRESRLPWIAGDEAGNFHAIWLDRPSASNPWTVEYQLIPAGGPIPPPIAVATGFSTDMNSDRLLGDFVGIAVDRGLPRMAWSEPRGTGGAVVRAAFGRCM
jgi:hypothetical protein